MTAVSKVGRQDPAYAKFRSKLEKKHHPAAAHCLFLRYGVHAASYKNERESSPCDCEAIHQLSGQIKNLLPFLTLLNCQDAIGTVIPAVLVMYT